jgi:SpoVK/Ycf46/Vps4 family AAA+-type ATPase
MDDINKLLRFYGLLTPSQKKNIFLNGVSTLEMTPEQSRALATWLSSKKYTPDPGMSNADMTGEDPVLRWQGHTVTKIQLSAVGTYNYYSDPLTRNAHGGYGADLRALTAEDALAEARETFHDAKPENIILENKVHYSVGISYKPDENPDSAGTSAFFFSLWKSGNTN